MKQSKRKCEHCQLEFEESVLIKTMLQGEERYFCCKGCEGVWTLLHAQGLEDFYTKLGNNHLEPINTQKEESLEHFDSQPFYEKYVRQKGDFCEISLILEKIHCIACVWLNETILSQKEGIIKVQVNYTNNKANILFDPKVLKISQILKTIRSIGYDAHPYDVLLQEYYANKEKRDYYIKMSVGIFCVMNIMWIAVAQYAGYFSGISSEIRNILNFASFILATPVLFFSGFIFWRGAYYALKNKHPNMDLLVISGASLGYFYSIYESFKGGETYFESVAMIVTFVLVGKFLEVRGKKSAVDSLDSLNSKIPVSVVAIRNQERVEVAPYAIKEGETIEVKAGERIALDGILLSSYAICDESALSGESLPIEKQQGEMIYSGSLALNFPFCYQVTKTLQNSLMTSIVNMVEDSLNVRPKIQEVANFITRYFSMVILTLAGLTFWVWYGGLNAGFDRALMVMISVIIIACPCALALATPIASLVGLGEAIKKKILFKEARFLETIAKADTLVLDKTGTLTQGNLKVIYAQNDKIQGRDLEILVEILAKNSHPISQAVLEFLNANPSNVSKSKITLDSLEQILARGMRAKVGEDWYLGGSLELLEDFKIPLSESFKEILAAYEGSFFCFVKNQEILGFYVLEDTLKEDAKEAILALKKMGIRITLLSGDNQKTCQKVAKALEIEEYYAKQTPQDKANFIDKLHQQGKIVIMAGDGINDSIALGKSDIAIAMGGGIDLAISVSDIVVLDDKMQGVKEAFRIGKCTFRVIKENLWLSLLYNTLTIPLAMMGYVIPLVAALSMSLSSLMVVGNSLRIKKM